MNIFSFWKKPKPKLESRFKHIKYSNDDEYLGELYGENRNGQGTYKFANGNRYEGEWKDHMKHGQGKYYYNNGELYTGEWQDNKKHGQGMHFYLNGDRYVGQWNQHKRHGQGTIYFPDHSIYTGQFHANKRSGLGYYYNAREKKYFEQLYADDDIVSNTEISSPPKEVRNIFHVSTRKNVPSAERPEVPQQPLLPNTNNNQVISSGEKKDNTSAPCESDHQKKSNEENNSSFQQNSQIGFETLQVLENIDQIQKNEKQRKMQEWQIEDVCQWLDTLELTQYKDAFITNQVTGNTLFQLTDNDLKEELGISVLGHRKAIIQQVELYKQYYLKLMQNKLKRKLKPNDGSEPKNQMLSQFNSIDNQKYVRLFSYMEKIEEEQQQEEILTPEGKVEGTSISSSPSEKKKKKRSDDTSSEKEKTKKRRNNKDSSSSSDKKKKRRNNNKNSSSSSDKKKKRRNNKDSSSSSDKKKKRKNNNKNSSSSDDKKKKRRNNINNKDSSSSSEKKRRRKASDQEEDLLESPLKLKRGKSKRQKKKKITEFKSLESPTEEEQPKSNKASPSRQREQQGHQGQVEARKVSQDSQHTQIEKELSSQLAPIPEQSNQGASLSPRMDIKSQNTEDISQCKLPTPMIIDNQLEQHVIAIHKLPSMEKKSHSEPVQKPELVQDSSSQESDVSSNNSSSSSSSDPSMKHQRRKKNPLHRTNSNNNRPKQFHMSTFMNMLEEFGINEKVLIKFSELALGPKIGEGGYGDVYKGKWLGQDVAIKSYGKRKSSGKLRYRLQMVDFLKEVEVISNLRHPNVVLYMGVCQKKFNYYLITEYLEQGSLFDHLHKKYTKFDSKSIMQIVEDIALGMNYLHGRKVLHCDLKSSNVLIDQNWNVKLCDFGLSRIKKKMDNKKQGKRIGTPHWMAPEIMRGESYQENADVYSFGMILWEMITCKIPYEGLSQTQIIGSVGYDGDQVNIPLSSEHPVLLQLVKMCLNKVPNKRPDFNQIVNIIQKGQKGDAHIKKQAIKQLIEFFE